MSHIQVSFQQAGIHICLHKLPCRNFVCVCGVRCHYEYNQRHIMTNLCSSFVRFILMRWVCQTNLGTCSRICILQHTIATSQWNFELYATLSGGAVICSYILHCHECSRVLHYYVFHVNWCVLLLNSILQSTLVVFSNSFLALYTRRRTQSRSKLSFVQICCCQGVIPSCSWLCFFVRVLGLSSNHFDVSMFRFFLLFQIRAQLIKFF